MLIRPATSADAPAMAALLNRVIEIGGTTAHQHAKTEAQVCADCIDGPEALICVVAEFDGVPSGFQAVGIWPDLPQGWGDIGTFVIPGLQAKGIGGSPLPPICRTAKSGRCSKSPLTSP